MTPPQRLFPTGGGREAIDRGAGGHGVGKARVQSVNARFVVSSERPVMDLHARLSAKERDELESLMEARYPDGPLAATITRLHGFLTSTVSGPMVMPSEWMPVVFGDASERAWETMDEAQRAMSLVMRFHNEVARDLGPDGRRYSILIDRIGDGSDTVDLADDWCKGYLLGIRFHEGAWKEAMSDPKLEPSFLPILALASPNDDGLDPFHERERYDKTVDVLPACAVEIHAWWRRKLGASVQAHSGTVRRTAPKISPNAPCPCGSGKKYKRCCSTHSPGRGEG